MVRVLRSQATDRHSSERWQLSKPGGSRPRGFRSTMIKILKIEGWVDPSFNV